MNESVYAEKLTWFKQNEKPETVLIITDNPELIKIVMAWANLEVTRADRLPELIGKSENEAWNCLWRYTKFNLTDLKIKSGVLFSESVLETKVRLLIGNRVLYPDGTVNSFVQRYLRAKVLELFEAKPKKSIQKTGLGSGSKWADKFTPREWLLNKILFFHSNSPTNLSGV
jgi:hypothetical protein